MSLIRLNLPISHSVMSILGYNNRLETRTVCVVQSYLIITDISLVFHWLLEVKIFHQSSNISAAFLPGCCSKFQSLIAGIVT